MTALGTTGVGYNALSTTAAHTARTLDLLVEAGASHIIMSLRAPWKLSAVEKLVRLD